ncbi:MAG: ATP-binding protein [Paludibacter sp.]
MESENQYVEWKESWRDEYIKWICGFANAQGGILVIGKNDKGEKVNNLTNIKQLSEEIPNKIRDLLGIMVDVNLYTEEEKAYLEIVVEPYPYPINYKGQYHYRSGSTKQELKGNALNKFILQKTGKHWDSVPLPNLKIDELEPAAFNLFRKKASRSKRVDEDTLNEPNQLLLNHLNLTDDGQLKRAAALLFHPQPEKFFTGAYVKIGYFENEADILYHDEIHGNILGQVDKTMELLQTKYLKAIIDYDGIQRTETFPYPEKALREAVLNAIAHKDYSSGIPIQIKVFDNKIRIWNDGQLPHNWTVANLLTSHPSQPGNPEVANAFFRAGMIESWGRGIEKIVSLCTQAGLPEPCFDTVFGGLQIEFYTTGKSIGKSIGKTSDKLIVLIKENNEITVDQLAALLNLTPGAINKQISILQKNNKLKRIGSRKSGTWQIIEKNV